MTKKRKRAKAPEAVDEAEESKPVREGISSYSKRVVVLPPDLHRTSGSARPPA